MRFLAIILLACVVMLSSFGGLVKPVTPKKTDCCKKAAKMACQEKQNDKKETNDACNQPGCAMMFACNLCGFIVERALMLQPPPPHILPKPVARYIPGNTAAYHSDNWKPPKAC